MPLSDVEARLAKVKSAAGHLQFALCEGFASSGGIAGSYAKKIFKAHFFDQQLPREIEPIKFLIDLEMRSRGISTQRSFRSGPGASH